MYYAKINDAFLLLEEKKGFIYSGPILQFVFFPEAATLLDSISAWKKLFTPAQIKKLGLSFHNLEKHCEHEQFSR